MFSFDILSEVLLTNTKIESITMIIPEFLKGSQKTSRVNSISRIRIDTNTINSLITTFDVPLRSKNITDYSRLLPNVKEFTIIPYGDEDITQKLSKFLHLNFRILLPQHRLISEMPKDSRFRYITL
jgi:hypothetical protein